MTLDPVTRLAIEKHTAVLKTEKRLERLTAELGKLAKQIPMKDMDEYVQITEKTTRRLNPVEED